MSKIYVIGHKSPDTDSIAAAISYSYLKQQQGVKPSLPERANRIRKPATRWTISR